MNFLKPKPTLTDEEISKGLRWMTLEGISSMGFGSITGSGFLAAYALILGANNFQIGILAALPFITQPLQIPLILVVERLKRRKLLAAGSWFLAQLFWIPIALIPVFISVPGALSVSALLSLMALRSLLGTITNANWNGWMRDLIPPEIRGTYLSRRLSYATVAAIVFGLGASGFVQFWEAQSAPENAVFGYVIAMLVGAVFLGMASSVFMALIPEPMMQSPIGEQPPLLKSLAQPLRNTNFRRLMNFLLIRSFTVNLAVPFFAVYMLQKIGLPLIVVISLTVLSQFSNVLFLRVWGPMLDRLGNKVILSVCTSLFLLVILGWTFTTLPGPHFLTLPMLVVLHIFVGIATAGINISTGTVGMKLAPQERAMPYLTGASIATNLGAGLAPLVGGYFADFFSVRSFQISAEWVDPAQVILLPAFSLTGYDFLFLISFILGLLSLNALSKVQEEGEVDRQVVLDELMGQSSDMTRVFNSVPGMRFAVQAPYNYLRNIPGVDVATGVTVYQLAASTRAASAAASRGRASANDVANGVSGAVTRIATHIDSGGASAAEIALHATRGAINAADNSVRGNVPVIAQGDMVGVMRALQDISVNPIQVLRGATRGAIRGAQEANVHVPTVAVHSVEGARQAASEMGLSEETAVQHAIEIALSEAEAIGEDELLEVQNALNPLMP